VSPDVDLRAPKFEDAADLAGVFREFGQAYGVEHDFQADIESWFTNPGMELERDARVAFSGSELVGYADASDAARDGASVYIDVRFHPNRHEAARPLFDFAEGRGGEMVKPGGAIQAWAPDGAGFLRGLIEGRGFTFNNYSFRMGRELGGDIAEPRWPEGIALRPFDSENDARLVYDVCQEALDDEPGHVRDPYDEWLHYAFREPFDPELWFLAFDDADLAGISLCRPQHGGAADRGWVQVLGVRRPWRRRGLGSALLLHSFREFQARGKREAGLGVSGENHGAVELYERAGMSIERTSLWYRKPVAQA
jgi:mycothiol synthase